jgi:hypothetical protein
LGSGLGLVLVLVLLRWLSLVVVVELATAVAVAGSAWILAVASAREWVLVVAAVRCCPVLVGCWRLEAGCWGSVVVVVGVSGLGGVGSGVGSVLPPLIPKSRLPHSTPKRVG